MTPPPWRTPWESFSPTRSAPIGWQRKGVAASSSTSTWNKPSPSSFAHSERPRRKRPPDGPVPALPQPPNRRRRSGGGGAPRKAEPVGHGASPVLPTRIEEETHRSCVRPSAFAEQMALLRREGYHLLPLSAVREHLDTKRPFPDRTVIVTFDDGFADNYQNAFPILQRESIPMTLFLTADFIGTDELPRAARSQRREAARLGSSKRDGAPRSRTRRAHAHPPEPHGPRRRSTSPRGHRMS